MSQVKIYGLAKTLNPMKSRLSDAIHACIVDALAFPLDKRAHRFFPLAEDDFYMPSGRSEAYLIIEIMMMTGRSVATKKKLIRQLYERLGAELAINEADIEICIIECAPENWAFRGQHGDEIKLNYAINI